MLFTKVAFLAVALRLVSALIVNTPTNVMTASPMVITWTFEAGDPPTMSVELMHPAFRNNFAIANNIDCSTGEMSINLPDIAATEGYTIQFVDISNVNKAYGTSGSFPVAPLASTSKPPTSTNATTPTLLTSTAAGSSVTRPAAATTSSSRNADASETSRAGLDSSSTPGSFNSAPSLRLNIASSAGPVAAILSAVAGAAFLVL